MIIPKRATLVICNRAGSWIKIASPQADRGRRVYMSKEANVIRNEFMDALDCLKVNDMFQKWCNCTLCCTYAGGILFSLCYLGKVSYLPKKSIEEYACLSIDINHIASFNQTLYIGYNIKLKKREQIDIMIKSFNMVMDAPFDEKLIFSRYGFAKGIIFVMQEMGILSYLDQEKVERHRGIAESIMEMADASDNMHDYVGSLLGNGNSGRDFR